MAGLQLIWAMVSRLLVSSAVRAPMRAAASAASVPGMSAADHQHVEVAACAHLVHDRGAGGRGEERGIGGLEKSPALTLPLDRNNPNAYTETAIHPTGGRNHEPTGTNSKSGWSR